MEASSLCTYYVIVGQMLSKFKTRSIKEYIEYICNYKVKTCTMYIYY